MSLAWRTVRPLQRPSRCGVAAGVTGLIAAVLVSAGAVQYDAGRAAEQPSPGVGQSLQSHLADGRAPGPAPDDGAARRGVGPAAD